MISVSEIQYSVKVIASDSTVGWSREFKQLEAWCKENVNNAYHVAKPKPQERIFIFNREEDATAFKLTWA